MHELIGLFEEMYGVKRHSSIRKYEKVFELPLQLTALKAQKSDGHRLDKEVSQLGRK